MRTCRLTWAASVFCDGAMQVDFGVSQRRFAMKASVEKGRDEKSGRNQHLQLMMRLGSTPAHKAKLTDFFRRVAQLTLGDGAGMPYISCSPFKNQSWPRMTGYVMKDRHFAHFMTRHSADFTPEVIEVARCCRVVVWGSCVVTSRVEGTLSGRSGCGVDISEGRAELSQLSEVA